MSRKGLSAWQQQVLSDIAVVQEGFPGDVDHLEEPRLKDGQMSLHLGLNTAWIPRSTSGLRLRDREHFWVRVPQTSLRPPQVEVDHPRFFDHPHILEGVRLCLFLDPAREWDPAHGFVGLLNRLTDWLRDAAAGVFDAQTALYHAVGGVLHETDGMPTVVVRGSLPLSQRTRQGWLATRTADRLDLLLDRPSSEADTPAEIVPIFRLAASLPLGVSRHFHGLLEAVEDRYIGYPSPEDAFREERALTGLSAALLTALGACAVRNPEGSAQRVVLAIPHPTGGQPHLLAASLPPRVADRLRAASRLSTRRSSMITIRPDEVGADAVIDWLPVSDERPEITTRRDSTRPLNAFAGKVVHLWGCGGLGSWIAEFVVRAGARTVVLCDPGRVTGGLLVRQNYAEADLGRSKVNALAVRLRAINDDVKVVPREGLIPNQEDVKAADVIIDATVSIAVGRILDAAAPEAKRAIFAQIVTDVSTGTLGVMAVSAPPEGRGPLTLDHQAGDTVRADGSLESFHPLWGSGQDAEELIPARGCSTPTYHGSAADLAGVAGSLVSLLGRHLEAEKPASGTHLIALPHSDVGPLHHFILAPSDQEES